MRILSLEVWLTWGFERRGTLSFEDVGLRAHKTARVKQSLCDMSIQFANDSHLIAHESDGGMFPLAIDLGAVSLVWLNWMRISTSYHLKSFRGILIA